MWFTTNRERLRVLEDRRRPFVRFFFRRRSADRSVVRLIALRSVVRLIGGLVCRPNDRSSVCRLVYCSSVCRSVNWSSVCRLATDLVRRRSDICEMFNYYFTVPVILSFSYFISSPERYHRWTCWFADGFYQ